MTKAWSKDDLDQLKKYYLNMELSQLAQILNRTPRAIESKASILGISKTKKWSQKDYAFLKSNYQIMSNNEIAIKLGRTVGAIERKAQQLDLKKPKDFICRIKRKWTSSEIEYLKMNYKKVSPRKICSELGITEGTLYRMASYYNLQETMKKGSQKTNTNKKWSDQEVEFLVMNYNSMTHEEIAFALGRTKQSIQKKLHYIDLRKYSKMENWSKEEIQYLRQNYKNGSIIQLQNHLNRTFKAIHTKANSLNLSRDVSTYIEREVSNILQKLTIPYEAEVKIRGFIVDFLLDGKKVIEVQGDYWHCNPALYDRPKDDIQRKKLKQDRMKRGCLNELGYNILYVWENDLNKNMDQVIEQIKQFAVL